MFTSVRLAVPLCLASAAAWASPATTDGARHLTEAFQTYLGPLPGVVAVVPQGETYGVTLNAAPLIALALQAGQQANMTPLVLTLTDQGGGLWGVVVDQAFECAVGPKDAPEFQLTIGRLSDKGTFDEALSAFAAETGLIDRMSWSQSMSQAMGHARWEVPSLRFEATSVTSPTGGLDRVTQVTIPEAVESISIPSETDSSGVPVGLTFKDYSFDWTVKGYRAREMLDVLAFIVANAADGQIESKMPALIGLATAALPVFDSVASTGTTGAIMAVTPWGDFAVTAGATAVELHGAVPDGLFREGIAIKGLKIPTALVPDWAAALLPNDASFDIAVTGYDAKAAADLALKQLNQPGPSPDIQDQLLAAALPSGSVTITFAPSVVTASGYSLAYEAAMKVGPATDIPTGTAKFTLTGIDAIIAALNAAPDDVKRELVPAAMLIRGMGKVGAPGTMVWDIDGSVPGKLLVNGNDVMSMMR